MICSGQRGNGAGQRRLVRAGSVRAIGAVLALLIGAFAAESTWAVEATGVAIIVPTGHDDIYKIGEDINLDVTFDGVVYVQDDEDSGKLELILSIGENSRPATYVDGSGSTDMKLHFRYTVQKGDEDKDGISIAHGSDSLVGGIIVDADSNELMAADRGFPAVGESSNHKVDGVIPEVDAVRFASDPDDPNDPNDSEDTYGLADVIEATVTFDEIVHVDETVSELVLVLSIGQHSRRATFVGGSGSTTLRFSYTVQRGDEDDDGISIGAGPGSLQGATIADFAGNTVDERAFDAVAADDAHKVDGVNPVLDAIDIVKPDGQVGTYTYGLNEKITVTVDFGEPVYVTQVEGDNLELILAIGAHSRSAELADGSGTTTLKFSYVVQSNDQDTDGITIGPTALRGGVIQDGTGNPADRTFAGVQAPNDHRVDGVSPVLRTMTIVSRPAREKYGLNEEIKVEVLFDEEVHVDEREGELVLLLAIGQHTREATFIDGSGTPALVFSYVVQSGDYDDDGVSIGPGINRPGEGSLRDAALHDKAGNPADRTFVGLAADDVHQVDGVRPSMKRVEIESDPDSGDTYGLDEEIVVHVDFGEEVYVDETDSDLEMVLAIGQHSRRAAYTDGSGTDTLVFGYVVQSDDYDSDGISIGPNALRGGAIRDAAGNTVDRTSAGVARDSDHRVDGTITSRTGVRIVSRPAARATYRLDEEIRVRVDFGEVVHVRGALTLLLSIGEHDRTATLTDGSGTPSLTFRYTVQSDDQDDDGISIGPNALEGGVIEDAAGKLVERTFAGLQADREHRVDGVVPVLDRVSIVSPPDHDGFYSLNEEITIEVDFGEEVHVKGVVTVDLTIGEHTRKATFVSGSGTETLTFRYVVQSNDQDDDGISIPPNCLDGEVVDAAGNLVDRTYLGRAPDSQHKVNGVDSARVRVQIVEPDGHDGIYGLNEEIRVQVDFPEEVHVTGGPRLVLSIGEHSRPATLVGGSGTTSLTFSYTVQAGDQDDDGLSIGPDALQGGVIENDAGNESERRDSRGGRLRRGSARHGTGVARALHR